MRIKKLGHCCLVVETKGVRIMTDPGDYSILQNTEKSIDIILITHEHQDHLHIESLKKIRENNPQAQIITNTSVGKLLEVEEIPYKIVDNLKKEIVLDVLIEGYGNKHAEIYNDFGQVENTGYLIDSYLFYPGDAFTQINKTFTVLALPVAGPWMQLKEALEYGLLLKPKKIFPVHDGMLNPKRLGPVHKIPKIIFDQAKIDFITLLEGEENIF